MKEKLDWLILILIMFFLGLVLIYQYSRPLAESMVQSILGKAPTIPVAVTVPMPPTPPIPEAAAPSAKKLPRDYDGISFFSGYKYVRTQIEEKYKPQPRSKRGVGNYWKILLESPIAGSGGRKIITLEYMGNPSFGYPRFVTFGFYQDKFVGVTEKYFKIDPRKKLEKYMAKYGKYNSQDEWKARYDRYTWEDSGMRIIFLIDKVAGTSATFDFQIKEFAQEIE
jgi:hypothetical protein